MAVRRRPATLAGLVAALVLACLPLLGRASLFEATSWIDAPLDGAVLPIDPYWVVAHSADQGGVAEVSFEVDGVLAASVPGFDAPRLLTSRYQWRPVRAGTYVITVRARNVDGEWGASASATVVISATAIGPAETGEPAESPSASATAVPTLGPGQTATPAPTGPPGQTPKPTKKPTPAPTVCALPTPNLLAPVGFIELDYPSEANPEFSWNLPSLDCIDHLVLHIEVPDWLGSDEEYTLANDAETFTRGRAALPWDPDNTGDNQCAHYHWYVMTFNEDGDAEQSAPGSFKVCELNPDA
jgi:hypothetical protein